MCPIAVWLRTCPFASAQHRQFPALQGQFHGTKIRALVRTIAKGLIFGSAARAPEIRIGLEIAKIRLIAVSSRESLLNPSELVSASQVQLQFHLVK
jgi:hypothetical protein